MKKYAVIKLIAYAFTAVVLTFVLIFGIISGGDSRFALNFAGFSVDGEDGISAGSQDVVLTDNVTDVSIEWVSGSISVVRSRDEKIRIHEEADGELASEETLVYKIDGNTLEIDFCKPKSGIFGTNMLSKNLTVELPEKYYDEINITSVSAEVDITGINVNSLDAESVSGSIEVKQTAFESADIESVSGNTDIYLPSDASFRLDFDSVSGRFNTDFDVKKHGDTYTAGDGAAEISAESVSGNVGVYKE